MANQFGIDLGSVYRTTEAIKGAREDRANKNQLMQWKKQDRDIASQRTKTLNALRAKAATGGRAEQQALAAFDPAEADSLLGAFSKMDEREQKIAQQNIDAVGRISAFIINSDNPEEAYQRARKNVAPEMAAQMPEQYDPNWVQMNLARAREIDKMMDVGTQTVGGEDILYRGGIEQERKTSNALLQERAKGGGGLKSTDESLMYRQAGELFGGIFDDLGNLQNLDPSTRGKVQSVATEATKIYEEGGVTRSEAVTKAARKLNINIEDLRQVEEGSSVTRRRYNPNTGTFE